MLDTKLHRFIIQMPVVEIPQRAFFHKQFDIEQLPDRFHESLRVQIRHKSKSRIRQEAPKIIE